MLLESVSGGGSHFVMLAINYLPDAILPDNLHAWMEIACINDLTHPTNPPENKTTKYKQPIWKSFLPKYYIKPPYSLIFNSIPRSVGLYFTSDDRGIRDIDDVRYHDHDHFWFGDRLASSLEQFAKKRNICNYRDPPWIFRLVFMIISLLWVYITICYRLHNNIYTK